MTSPSFFFLNLHAGGDVEPPNRRTALLSLVESGYPLLGACDPEHLSTLAFDSAGDRLRWRAEGRESVHLFRFDSARTQAARADGKRSVHFDRTLVLDLLYPDQKYTGAIFLNRDKADFRESNLRFTVGCTPARRRAEPTGSQVARLPGFWEALERRIAWAVDHPSGCREHRRCALTDEMLAEYLRETAKNPALLLGSLNEHRAYLKGKYGFRPSTTVVRELLAGRLRPLSGAPYAAIAAVRDRLPEARAEAGLRPLSGRLRKGGAS